ncbi:MAG TPA: beta-propeller fold lactonase family protein, partial [Wenzhouxiangella sp.]|nr:beta-propeller fold lactonase family protein [Wenzhouxiangella sp.]
SADATVNVFLESDLRINKSADASLVHSGDSLTYSYTISNLGPHEATGVTVTDTFDRSAAVASFNASPPSDWSCQEVIPAPIGATAIECQLDAGQTLPPDGSTRLLSLTVTPSAVDDAVVLGNQAEITADQRLPASPQNTSAVVEVDLVPSADLSLARAGVSATPIDAESGFSWSMEIENGGPSLARDLTLVENLPDGVMVTGFASPDGWSCSANQRLGSYRCQLDELGVGTSTLTISAVAPRNPSLPGQATAPSPFGVASVDAQTHDPVPGNNQAGSDSITVAAVWDLAINKDSAAELLVPEQAFTYDITVTNAGPSDLVGGLRPLLDDAFDPRLRGVIGMCATSAVEPCWSCGWDARPILDQAIDTTAGATTGLVGAWSLALAPDRNHVYVGGRFDDAIAVLDRDNVRGAGFGQLSFSGFNDELGAPRALAVHPGGEWLVAAGHGSGAELELFSRNPATGALSAVFTLSESVAAPADLLFSPDGRFLYLAESGADRIRQLAFDAQAQTLSLVADVVRDAASGNSVLLGGVAGLALSPDGDWLYAAAPDDQAVVAFSVDAASGHLTPLSTASRTMDNGAGPVAVRVVEAGVDEVFAGGGDSLFVIERTGTGGELGTATSFVASSVPDKRLQGVSGLVLSGDGNSLFVSAAAGAAISLFERDSGGAVRFVRSVGLPDGLEANGAVLDATGERLYVSATSSDVSASTAPDTGAVLVYRTVAAGACDDMRSGEI